MQLINHGAPKNGVIACRGVCSLSIWNRVGSVSKCHLGSLHFLLLLLFVIVRVVDTLHKGFAVVDFVGQSRLQKSLDI